MSEKYMLVRTDTADSGLRKIILSIAETFGNETALKKSDLMEEKLRTLETMPYVGSILHYMVLKRLGYRVLMLKKSLIRHRLPLTDRRMI